MKNIAIWITVLSILCMTGAAQGQSDKDVGDPNSRVFEGKVTAVDTGAATVTIDGGVITTFRILSDTKLTKDSYDIRLSDVSVGDYVNVEYTKEEDGGSRVFRLTILYKASKNKPRSYE